MKRSSSLEDWDKFWDPERSVGEIYPASESIVENLKEVVEVTGKNILEVGAGTGRDSIRLSSMGGNVTVLDYSENALMKIREAVNQSGTTVVFVKGDGTKLPFDDETFDIVFHQGLMEHFRDPLPLFRENVRVLKKGGLLLVDVPQKYHVYTIIKHILIMFNKWFAGWETEFSIRQLRKIYRDHHLVVCREYGDYMVPSFFYRTLREVLKLTGIKLPMYPKSLPVLGSIRKACKSFVIKRRLTLYTFLTIGIIGKKV
ncbi:methyltransferase domain-containing protein [candidate division KSB1 bacterium]